MGSCNHTFFLILFPILLLRHGYLCLSIITTRIKHQGEEPGSNPCRKAPAPVRSQMRDLRPDNHESPMFTDCHGIPSRVASTETLGSALKRASSTT